MGGGQKKKKKNKKKRHAWRPNRVSSSSRVQITYGERRTTANKKNIGQENETVRLRSSTENVNCYYL